MGIGQAPLGERKRVKLSLLENLVSICFLHIEFRQHVLFLFWRIHSAIRLVSLLENPLRHTHLFVVYRPTLPRLVRQGLPLVVNCGGWFDPWRILKIEQKGRCSDDDLNLALAHSFLCHLRFNDH